MSYEKIQFSVKVDVAIDGQDYTTIARIVDPDVKMSVGHELVAVEKWIAETTQEIVTAYWETFGT